MCSLCLVSLDIKFGYRILYVSKLGSLDSGYLLDLTVKPHFSTQSELISTHPMHFAIMLPSYKKEVPSPLSHLSETLIRNAIRPESGNLLYV